ncbi:McrB family protein [Fictibacillus phosphorivorans]|uniref:McrB family protein n=1 Tax=Fictibacillus phosphorivorans TaxID=1221500 RepID=UPI003CF72E21
MIQADNLVTIMNIDDTTERNERILNEVQPVIRRVINAFLEKYGDREPYLRQLRVHTHEQTLRTTIADSKNPKYADKKKHYGNRGFVELIDDQYEDTILVVLRMEFHLENGEIRIGSTSDFYPFWVFYKKTLVLEMEEMIKELHKSIRIFTTQGVIEHEDFITTVGQFLNEKRKPTINFGTSIPLQGSLNEESLIDHLWEVYQHLSPVRHLLEKESQIHSKSITFMKLLHKDTNSFPIELFSKVYRVETEAEVKKIRVNVYKQEFKIYDQDQLITDGQMEYYYRDPHESIGVIINNYGHLFNQVRKVATSTSSFDWYIKKSFYQRGKYNENNENQLYRVKIIDLFKEHNLKLNESNAFFVGTYLGDSHTFTEPISKIKERLITAACLSADVKEFFVFPKGSSPVEAPGGEEDEDTENIVTYESSFDFEQIIDLVNQSGLTFSSEIVRDFYLNLTSLDDKHFVILNGISGTGKTQLCKVFANAVYGLDYKEDNPYMRIVPVRPDWMDSTSLFGYYSSFEKAYMQTEFLKLLLQANKEKDKPFFVVLDEMNLARVEYYLSDYLSAVESRKPIQLHNQNNLIDIPQKIEIPHNFYVIGTINVDETTHSISDKVLDRAFVMTLSDVDFSTFWETLDEKWKSSVQGEWRLLLQVHQLLAEYELHFGYRTMTEMIRKLHKNRTLPVDFQMDSKVAVDRILTEKVIPKIKGDERIALLLEDLQQILLIEFGIQSESYKHISRMRKELERYGATQFWR